MQQKKFSIVYAEDDDFIREKYAKFLNLYFLNVYEAVNGQEALELYTKHKPHVILLDINMPLVNGLEVAKLIRENDKLIQIIILSAYSDKEKLLEAIELSLIKYLIKPIQSIELEDIIVKCIESINETINTQTLLLLDGGFVWNKTEKSLSKDNKIIKLTKKELLLLKLFCSNPNLIFSNTDIMNYVWAEDIESEFNANRLRIVFSKLKTKLSFSLFDSIYNVGYRLKKH